jgi:gamma-glutamyltranspeptidase
MTRFRFVHSWFLATAFLAAIIAAPAMADTAIAERAMVATGNPIATDAAVEVLREGGNAVDAAVTAALSQRGRQHHGD